jgi:acetylornithine/succinyldiaminopimelate/putrescine aminotransferase
MAAPGEGRALDVGKLVDDVFHKGWDEFQEFVNPLIAQRARLAAEPLRLVAAAGGPPADEEGRRVEDLHGTQMLGHRNPVVAAAVRAFLETEAPNWYPARVNPFVGRLARRLCERTGYSNAYFGCSGSDAVEAAMKLARAATKRPRFLALEGAYHGCGVGSTSLMTPGPFRELFGTLVADAETLPFADTDALARALERQDVACVVVEPVQGEGGVRPLPAPYVAALCELTARHGALLVADEVQTGLGRSGHFALTETWPRRPDVLLLAKGLGGGLLPVSAMLTTRALFERAYGANFQTGEAHNCTFSFNAVTAVAALATLELLTDELFAMVSQKGKLFHEALAERMHGSPLLSEVRGVGLMLGVALRPFDHPWLSFEHFGFGEHEALARRPSVAPLVCHRLYQHGYFAFTCGHDWSVLRLQPRFEIAPEALLRFADLLRRETDHLLELT